MHTSTHQSRLLASDALDVHDSPVDPGAASQPGRPAVMIGEGYHRPKLSPSYSQKGLENAHLASCDN